MNASKDFSPGVCRGDSQTWLKFSCCFIENIFYFSIPLIAGILASCAAGCAFFAEHILALMNGLIFKKNFY